MQRLALKTGDDFTNLSLDLGKVKSIKMDVDNPKVPKIWILYFYRQFKNGKQYVTRIWFYPTEKDRTIQLERIMKQYPHIQVR